MKELFFLLLSVVAAYGIAKYLGSERHIGFFWSMFFSLLLSPPVGLIITLFSDSKNEPLQAPSTAMVVLGRMMIVLFGSMFLWISLGFAGEYVSNRLFGTLFTLGLFGFGVYSVKLGKCNFERTN